MALVELKTTMTCPKMWKDSISPATFVVKLNHAPGKQLSYRISSKTQYMQTRKSLSGYRENFRLKEEAMGQEDKAFLCVSDSPRKREERQVKIKGPKAQ